MCTRLLLAYAAIAQMIPQRNEYLSNQRAQNVYDALVNKFGVSPKSLKIVPRKGQSVPFDNARLTGYRSSSKSSVRIFCKRLSGFRTPFFTRGWVSRVFSAARGVSLYGLRSVSSALTVTKLADMTMNIRSKQTV